MSAGDRGNASGILRDLPLHTQGVRIGRARTAQASQAIQAARADPPPTPAAPTPADHADAERLRLTIEAGRQEGFQQGLARAQAQVQATAEQAVQAAVSQAVAEATQALAASREQLEAVLRALNEQARHLQAATLAAAQDDLIALALSLTARVIGPALASPDGVQAQLRALLAQQSALPAPLAVHLHPRDAAALSAASQSSNPPSDLPPLVADPQVALGGCVLHTAAGSLDARLEVVLAQCQAWLLALRAQGPGTHNPDEAAP